MTVTDPSQPSGQTDLLRAHAEDEHAAELTALAAADDRPRPPQWRLSPWAVATYLLAFAVVVVILVIVPPF